LNILEGFRPGFQDISAGTAEDADMTVSPGPPPAVSYGRAPGRLRSAAAESLLGDRFLRQSIRLFALLIFISHWAVFVAAQDFAVYPSAHPDDKAARAASAADLGVECRVFISGDSFEKIYVFYHSRYKELTSPFPGQKLPDGRVVKWAFFVLDGTSSLSRSRYWMKVQWPAIDSVNDAGEFTNVRDSVIEVIRKP
jgi:hypothetical protein